MGQILKYRGMGWAGLLVAAAWAGCVPTGYVAAAFDPTAPPRTQAAATPAQNLSRLAWVRVDGGNSIAWYGGATVKLGERVEGGRVVAIHEDHIVIAGRDGRRTIPLLDTQVRHQPVTLPRSPRRK